MAAAEVKTSIKKVNKPIESEVSQDSGLCVSLQDTSKPFESTGEELKENIKYPSQLLESSSASEIAANIADSSISGERQGRRRNYLTNWNCSRSLRIRKQNAKTDLSASAVIEEEAHSVRLKRSGAMRRDKALGNGLGGGEENMAKGSEDDLARLFWQDVDRRGAEACLAQNYYPEGAFLLRPSSEPNVIALSLKTAKKGKRNVIVKHFRIKFDPQHQHYYLSKTSVYSSLSDFIRCHEVSAGGLPCRLVPSSADGVVIGSPPQSAPPRHQDPTPDFHIHRNSLVLRRRIGCGSFGEVCAETTTSVSDAVGCMPTYIVTELMAYGSLKTFIQRRKAQPLVYEQLIDFMVQVSDGMSYLERQNYIHRDLRASNVLVGENLTLKVADFGLAHILGDDTEYLGNVGK
ncbi:unnamed protein product [Dibothriocephalus latus]|uniref:Tyrosine-protein kinase n=1 Tax=Dibothriocephalus latus TaxID=60516 RepID=A0A3P7KZH5_DIBLA|nr:unnamed protein product [Dibothriocephalus latus]